MMSDWWVFRNPDDLHTPGSKPTAKKKAEIIRLLSFYSVSLTTFRAQKSDRSISRPMMTFTMSMNCTHI